LHAKIDEMHAYTASLESKLKEAIPTSCSTCEMHALKNLELVHYVDRLQDENDELRKLMGWLSGHEPQLRMMIETFKRQDGEGFGANKVGEGSGENIPEPPKTHHKNDFPPKPNHIRNRLDTTPAPPVFLMDRLGDRRGGSEWEPIKILLKNLAYAPKSLPKNLAHTFQDHVVTTDLLTLGTS
jgi:hypothetical protein